MLESLVIAGLIVGAAKELTGSNKKKKKYYKKNKKRGDTNYRDAYGWSHDHNKKLF